MLFKHCTAAAADLTAVIVLEYPEPWHAVQPKFRFRLHSAVDSRADPSKIWAVPGDVKAEKKSRVRALKFISASQYQGQPGCPLQDMGCTRRCQVAEEIACSVTEFRFRLHSAGEAVPPRFGLSPTLSRRKSQGEHFNEILVTL